MNLDQDSLRADIRRGNSIIYGKSEDKTPFFNLKSKLHQRGSEKICKAIIRLVANPEGQGICHRIIHENVGRPGIGEGPKTFLCRGYRNLPCMICKVLSLEKDPAFNDLRIKFPETRWENREKIITLKEIPVSGKGNFSLFSRIWATPLLTAMVIEPKYYGNTDYDKGRDIVSGLQKIWFKKKTLVTKMWNLILDKPKNYFTHPERGHNIIIDFNAVDRNAADMYQVRAGKRFELEEGLEEQAIDPQAFSLKLRTNEEMKDKLVEMFGKAAHLIDFKALLKEAEEEEEEIREDSDDDDDRPRKSHGKSRRRDDDEEDDTDEDDDDEEEERPRKNKKIKSRRYEEDDEEDEDDRPKKKHKSSRYEDDDDDEDEKPKKKKSKYDEEEDDDDDERPRKSSKKSRSRYSDDDEDGEDTEEEDEEEEKPRNRSRMTLSISKRR